MAAPAIWYVRSDNQVVIDKLKFETNSEYVNDASIVGQVMDEAEENMGDEITFTYVAESDGMYVGIIPHSIEMQKDLTYVLEITITVGEFQHVQRIARLADYDNR